MNALRRQFFLSYAIIGSVMPLLTVFLKTQASFSFLQIGLAMSLMSVPMLCSPALITLLADKNVDPRRILAVAFSLSATVLTTIYFSQSITLTLVLFVFHGLCFVAMLPLQDGFFFSLAEELKRDGSVKPPEYPLVRIWGTIGFILPSIIQFFILSKTDSPRLIIPCAVSFCLLSLINSFTLPKLKSHSLSKTKLPTRKALATLFSPEARWLCIALSSGFVATSIYYGFIANYYTEVVNVPNKFVGLIINIGVVLEILYTLFMPRLQQWIQLRGILITGLAFMALRMFLLWLFPTTTTVIVTQIGHGMEVLAMFVVPVMFLNRLATDQFRNSIQGVYTMVVGGVSRVAGGVLGGWLAITIGLEKLFLVSGFFALTAMLVILFLFARIPPPSEKKTTLIQTH